MGIFKRFFQIISSYFHAALDRLEDPSKMVDQYIRETESALGEVKAHTADSMVIAKRAHDKVSSCEKDILEMQNYAKKAIDAENEEDLIQFAAKINELEDNLEELKLAALAADDNVAELRQMHDELTDTLADYKSKRDSLKSKIAVAKANEKIATLTGLSSGIASLDESFTRLEGKINESIARNDALKELSVKQDKLSDLKKKYNNTADSRVMDTVEALKKANAS